MTKHTPGPWSVGMSNGCNGNNVYAIGDVGVASVYGAALHCTVKEQPSWAGEAVANAHLIAAAPDLLDAVKWFVQNDDIHQGNEPEEHLGGRSWNEVNAYWIEGLNKALTAIAKAEGL